MKHERPSDSAENSIKRFINAFSDVFISFGISNPVYKILFNINTIPAVCTARSAPHTLKDKLNPGLERLASLDAVAECPEPGGWLNSTVTALKPIGSLKICLDLQKLDKDTIRERYTLPKVSDISARKAGLKIYTTLDAQSGFH